MTETIPYNVTGKDGEIEFRDYPAIVLATVDDPGDDSGFRLLFGYITGGNRQKAAIPMTSPVVTSLQIPMTAPVVSDETSMSFVLPPGMRRDEVPEPLDPRVRITMLPARKLAVIRFRGRATREDVAAAEERLAEGLERAGIAAAGRPFLMRYNPPWTPGFLRRTEVAVEISR